MKNKLKIYLNNVLKHILCCLTRASARRMTQAALVRQERLVDLEDLTHLRCSGDILEEWEALEACSEICSLDKQDLEQLQTSILLKTEEMST